MVYPTRAGIETSGSSRISIAVIDARDIPTLFDKRYQNIEFAARRKAAPLFGTS
jgi:hypothetical protein